jgi:Flp pilus assembly protein TadG
MNWKKAAKQSGQALLEFALVALLMITLAFGVIDFSRAIYDKQVMTNLTREASNLASRGIKLPEAVAAVTAGAAPLDMAKKGRIILTSVENHSGTCRIKAQEFSAGGIAVRSRLGKKAGDPVTCPADGIPQPNQTAYVTELFYSYEPVTPVGQLLKIAMPTTLYDVAYF